MNNFEISAVALSLGLLFSYHFHLYSKVFYTNNSKTQLSINIRNSLNWLIKHVRNPDPASVTLSIQTLRNTILVAVFVGGSTFNYGFNFVNNYESTTNDKRLETRAIIVSVLLFSSFLCWACVIRFASQLGYIIGTLSYYSKEKKGKDKQCPEIESLIAKVTSDEVEKPSIDQKDIESNEHKVDIKEYSFSTSMHLEDNFIESSKMVKLLIIYFSLGFRFMFVSLPFAFFTMGALGLVLSTIAILIFLYFFDYKF